MARICVVDTETTGLPDQYRLARVVEVGAVILEADGSEVSHFESVCNPGDWLLSKAQLGAMQINRLSIDALKSAPASSAVGLQLAAWLAGHQCNVLTSYNVRFDFHPLLLGSLEWLGGDANLRLAPCLMQMACNVLAKQPNPESDASFLRLPMAVANIQYRNPDVPVLGRLYRPSGPVPSFARQHTALEDAQAAAYVARFFMPWLQHEPDWKPFPSGNRSVRSTLTPMTRAQLAELAKQS